MKIMNEMHRFILTLRKYKLIVNTAIHIHNDYFFAWNYWIGTTESHYVIGSGSILCNSRPINLFGTGSDRTFLIYTLCSLSVIFPEVHWVIRGRCTVYRYLIPSRALRESICCFRYQKTNEKLHDINDKITHSSAWVAQSLAWQSLISP